LLLGVDDGGKLSEPIAGIDDRGMKVGSIQSRLLYLRTFDESVVKIKELEPDVTNPRYGQPKLYEVDFTDQVSGLEAGKGVSTMVHWSRIIHVADNRLNSEVYGLPRMEKVFNRLLDLRKIAGGSGEMFWKGGFPGLSLESHPGADDEAVEFDEKATKDQIEAYMNGLQRYLATVGMTAKSLSVQISDPGPHADLQLKLVSIALGVPWRIFVGSEVGQLASQQDSMAWNRRINRRRIDYVTPFIINPFVDRLIAIGVLPEVGEGGYHVEWKDLNTPGDKDQAEVADKRANAISKYISSGADALIPPHFFLTRVLGMSEDEAFSILEKADLDMLASIGQQRLAQDTQQDTQSVSRNGE